MFIYFLRTEFDFLSFKYVILYICVGDWNPVVEIDYLSTTEI